MADQGVHPGQPGPQQDDGINNVGGEGFPARFYLANAISAIRRYFGPIFLFSNLTLAIIMGAVLADQALDIASENSYINLCCRALGASIAISSFARASLHLSDGLQVHKSLFVLFISAFFVVVTQVNLSTNLKMTILQDIPRISPFFFFGLHIFLLKYRDSGFGSRQGMMFCFAWTAFCIAIVNLLPVSEAGLKHLAISASLGMMIAFLCWFVHRIRNFPGQVDFSMDRCRIAYRLLRQDFTSISWFILGARACVGFITLVLARRL